MFVSFISITLQMGAKPSIKIETPVFAQADWQYEPPQNQNNPEYGIYRTLSNRKTGEMIDQFDMSWVNEEQYSYYLKSFNWRYNQPNVVNTRFIVQKSTHQFCSQTFVARVYIEHIIVRLSQINDIPFPQNLYVLMEALEGYAKIFQHSKYFVIEENQICVDVSGNVKIWVNSDLSINYPNSDHYQDDKNIGQEMMVDKLVHLIAENTDRQSEPELSFLEYFLQKKGFRGRKFEQARVLVLSYARLNQTQIPDKFETVLSLAKEDQMTVQENQNVDYQDNLVGHVPERQQNQRENNVFLDKYYQPPRYQEEVYRSAAHPIAVIPPPVPYQYPVQSQYAPYPAYQPQINQGIPYGHNPYNNMSNMAFKGYPMQQIPHQVQYIPHYTRVQYPVNIVNQVPFQMPIQAFQSQPQQSSYQPQISNQSNVSKQLIWQEQPKNSNHPKVLEQSRRERPPELNIDKKKSKGKLSQLQSPVDIRVSPLNNLNGADIRVTLYNDHDNFVQQHHQTEEYINRGESDEEQYVEVPPNSVFPKKNHQVGLDNRLQGQQFSKTYHQNAEISEVDDMVAKSLPIKTGYPASTNSPMLNGFGQSDRSAYSHIHSKDHVDSFGLSASGQVKLKDSMQGKLKESESKGKQNIGTKGSTIAKLNNKATVKYYYSLQEQLEIDPDIAADMERYLIT